MSTVNYQVPGISCGHCTSTIEEQLNKIAGVGDVWADQESRTVEVTFQPPATEQVIQDTLSEIGYPPNIA